MKSIKCPQCGLVYWATDAKCKRCGLPATEMPTADPNYVPSQNLAHRPMPPQTFTDDAEMTKMLKKLKRGSIYFYVIGGLQILLWLAVGQLLIVDGVLNIALSFCAYKFRSRVAALLLLGLTLLAVLSGIVAFEAGTQTAAVLPIGMIIRFLVSGRMVQATFKLNGYIEEGPPKVLPPPPPNFHPEATSQWARDSSRLIYPSDTEAAPT